MEQENSESNGAESTDVTPVSGVTSSDPASTKETLLNGIQTDQDPAESESQKPESAPDSYASQEQSAPISAPVNATDGVEQVSDSAPVEANAAEQEAGN